MRLFKFSFSFLPALALLLSASCSGGGKTMVIKGSFKNLKQGQFYAYSYSPEWDAFDTIPVEGGSFEFQHEISDTTIIVLQYPNFMQTPLVAIPGKTVKVKGNANDLARTDVSGNEENELLSQFRKEVFELTPEQKTDYAEKFITEHPGSFAAVVLLYDYFLNKDDLDWNKTDKLFQLIKKNAPNRPLTHLIEGQLKPMLRCKTGNTLPPFTATTLKKEKINNATFKGKWLLVNIWATWERGMCTSVAKARKVSLPYAKKLKLLNICLDADTVSCNLVIQRDSLTGYNVCDCQSWESPLVKAFGVRFIPGNILVDGTGKVVARDIEEENLEEKLRKYIK